MPAATLPVAELEAFQSEVSDLQEQKVAVQLSKRHTASCVSEIHCSIARVLLLPGSAAQFSKMVGLSMMIGSKAVWIPFREGKILWRLIGGGRYLWVQLQAAWKVLVLDSHIYRLCVESPTWHHFNTAPTRRLCNCKAWCSRSAMPRPIRGRERGNGLDWGSHSFLIIIDYKTRLNENDLFMFGTFRLMRHLASIILIRLI